MRRILCKSKIHRATLTGADLNYEGSLTLDRALMDAADMLPYERVQVVNVNNGARLETYLIPGDAGSGVVQLNGAGARLGAPGDIVILMTLRRVRGGRGGRALHAARRLGRREEPNHLRRLVLSALPPTLGRGSLPRSTVPTLPPHRLS